MRLLSLVLLLAPLLFPAPARAQKIQAGGPVSPDGAEQVQIDYPHQQCQKNTGGTDGAGLCVFYSITFAARWQNERLLTDFNEKMKREKGGGWPAKVDAMIAKYGKGAAYLQYEGTDLAVLRAALRAGRMPAVTYNGSDGVFYKGPIAHMVCLVHLSDKWAAIRDNNFIGDNQVLWMPPAEFARRWAGGRQGWAVVLLAPPPPPVPTLAGPTQPPVLARAPEPRARGFAQPPEPGCRVFWYQQPGDPQRRYLFRGERQAGCLDVDTGAFRRFRADTKEWGRACSCRVAPLEGGCWDYGVHAEEIECRGERFTLSGRAVGRDEALAAVGQVKLPEDAGKLRLTLIGPDAVKLAADLERSEALAPWKGRLLVQTYPEGAAHWHLAGLGFPEGGLVLQQPARADGRGLVLHQQAEYDGPERLARALRRADPQYDGKKAPDLTRPALPGLPEGVPAGAVVILAAVGAGLLLRR